MTEDEFDQEMQIALKRLSKYQFRLLEEFLVRCFDYSKFKNSPLRNSEMKRAEKILKVANKFKPLAPFAGILYYST